MAEISDKDLKKIGEFLNRTISSSLYGPPGDPSWEECSAAATCFKILQILRLPVKGEEDARRQLEVDNIHNHNFLK